MKATEFLTNGIYKIAGQVVPGWAALLASIILITSIVFLPRLRRWLENRFAGDNETNRRFLSVSSYVLYFLVLLVVVNLLGLYSPIKAGLGSIHHEVSALLDLKLFAIGKTSMTVWTCIYVFALSWILIRSTEQLSAIFSSKMSAKTKLDRGLVEMCAAGTRYFIMVVGLAVILQSAGVDLSALSFVAGAAGIAIGLGLQALMNNVVSGFVILVDRPIKIGDRIDIGGINGEVTHISIRATTIITNDNIAVIVPNSQFISSQVVNWTYKSKRCRFQIPFSTARDATPGLIKRLLTEVAQEHQGVLESPPPKACLDEIGEAKLKFSLSVWTEDYVARSGELRSDINYAIAKKFADQGLTLDGVAAKGDMADKNAQGESQTIAPKQGKAA